jgi:hypothetical protein
MICNYCTSDIPKAGCRCSRCSRESYFILASDFETPGQNGSDTRLGSASKSELPVGVDSEHRVLVDVAPTALEAVRAGVVTDKKTLTSSRNNRDQTVV